MVLKEVLEKSKALFNLQIKASVGLFQEVYPLKFEFHLDLKKLIAVKMVENMLLMFTLNWTCNHRKISLELYGKYKTERESAFYLWWMQTNSTYIFPIYKCISILHRT